MAPNRPLSDDEVMTEMKKMVSFIKQEAMEKAREIQIKADEEFAIEKAKIVRQEAINIDASYEKKFKQAEVAQKIAQSNATNKSRLAVLQARESKLQELFTAARDGLADITKDNSKYEKLLSDLILQGLLQLMEDKVEVTVREQDVDVAKSAASKATEAYQEKSGKSTSVDVKSGLGKNSSGGVILAGFGGKIKVNNTLEERLRLMEERMLPEIRMDLYGANPSRKFTN
ncbi:V-ATPase V1 sector subunit E [Tilletia horrida]|uniref:V-ATPase V1 sector subunit E n=1 Tax=Tilletia horrida TaxID=155126 RepID=A0AAN6GK08_9BASI|nr:V-ATPase V1 sector subunit E [Tilletia horrida]KAK0531446.1 V-ATPase V1 sector subunit E [Tilletia horrida]KAK0541308.1 V-ATPase V1 sector subunit E [Tilletia horrida]KAK0563878.1 V-ATPase V1 sector subunit E [Tilletia horrida]